MFHWSSWGSEYPRFGQCSPFQVGPWVLLMWAQESLTAFFVCGVTRYFIFILYMSCPRSTIGHFFKESVLFLFSGEIVFQDYSWVSKGTHLWTGFIVKNTHRKCMTYNTYGTTTSVKKQNVEEAQKCPRGSLHDRSLFLPLTVTVLIFMLIRSLLFLFVLSFMYISPSR